MTALLHIGRAAGTLLFIWLTWASWENAGEDDLRRRMCLPAREPGRSWNIGGGVVFLLIAFLLSRGL